MGGLETDVIPDRDLNRAMAEQQTDELVIARLVLEDDRRREVAELMHGETQTDRFFDGARNLTAQRRETLVALPCPREEPRIFRAIGDERGTIIGQIIVDERGQLGIEREVELDPVLDIIVREDEPIGSLRSPGTNEILADPDFPEIAAADRGNIEDADRDARTAALTGEE
jgi:hypothetical protein